MYTTLAHAKQFLIPHPNDAVSSPLGLDLNFSGLNIHRENMFLDDPEADFNITTVSDTRYSSVRSFDDLNLSPEVLRALYADMGYRRPSKIQANTLPMILSPPYKDLVAQAHNGTGKTTCFGLGMLGRIDPGVKAPQALCICPTRELAIQILEVLQRMGMYTGINIECAVPCVTPSATSVHDRAPVTAHIVIGTSGTVHKLISYKKLGVSKLKVLVFDEADHMLAEDGFRDDSLRIKKEIDKFSPHCQVLLFSATFNEMITKFIPRVMKDYNQLTLKKEELSLEAVKQYKVYCPDELDKIEVIRSKIFDLGDYIGQTIIFVRSRNSAKMLHEELVRDGHSVTTVHGALSIEDRDKIVKEFKDGLTKVLISTDLLARGFDQQQVNCVVNYDLPIKRVASSSTRDTPEPDYELYLHRCGRAGRFGSKGAVFNLLCLDTDKLVMANIERYYNIQVPEVNTWNSERAFQGALRAAGLL
ncbi:PREDICTED: DEAD-box ATP-dependent RNA helicase 38-like [Fragaria vesca subsp. vesca]